MKDYSGLSDFEINKLVAETLGNRNVTLPAECLSGSVVRYAVQRSSKKLNREGLIEVDTHEVRKDFCNNPSDAWPIIIANEIGFEKETRICCDHCNELYTTEMWEASHATECHSAEHTNPLRACMIVYLMSRESWGSHG